MRFCRISPNCENAFMRSSQLNELIQDEFGVAMAAHLRGSHVLSGVPGELTADAALAAGVPPRQIWQALCEDFDVPVERRLGVDPGEKRR